jgi:hypothetical protein
VLLVALFLFENLSIPLPVSDMRVPQAYHILAEEHPGDFTLLDLPVAWRNGFRVLGTQHPTIMFQQYYQTVHGKPILAGNTSRNPPFKFQYFAEAPIINTLIALETGHQVEQPVLEHDRELAPMVLRFFNIQSILVHRHGYEEDQTAPAMLQYVAQVLQARPVYEDDGIVGYQVELPPWPGVWRVEPGTALGRLSYAEGWGVPAGDAIWAQRPSARLLVPLNGAAQQMAFRAYAPAAGQRLRLEANGQVLHEVEMAPGWRDYELTLPAEAVHAGLNKVRLHFDALHPAGGVRLSPRTIGQTGVESPVNLVAESAGQEIGDFGHIYVDGRDISPNERGYNVAILHPETGEVEAVASFDTHLDEGASRELAAFLGQVPEGRIVVVAAADEASRLLEQDTVDALGALGAAVDLRDKYRWGHALIGVQGSRPGSALEAADWMRPVRVVVGEGATEPRLAALLGTIVFTAASDP